MLNIRFKLSLLAWVVVLLGIFWFFRGADQDAGSAGREGSQPVNATKIRVACIGDGITLGDSIEDQENRCYPTRLAKLMGAEYDVRNFGSSGATLLRFGDRPYFKQDEFEAALRFDPDFVFVMLGTHDSKPENWNDNASEFELDCEWLIRRLLDLPSGPSVVLCLPLPVAINRWEIREEILRQQVVPKLQKVAERLGIPLLNLDQPFLDQKELLADGVHPNAKGANAIANRAAELLHELRQKKMGTREIGVFRDKRINECSGMVPSSQNNGCFWVHNDSGDAARIFLVRASGQTKMEVVLAETKNVDFEDIALAEHKGRPYIVVGDVGDNQRRRGQYLLYVFEEPTLSVQARANLDSVQKKVLRDYTRIRFTFDDANSHDCEGIAYRPSTNQFVISTKLTSSEVLAGHSAEVFALDAIFTGNFKVAVAKKIGTLPGGVLTAFDISADGSQAVVRNYLGGYIFPVANDRQQFVKGKPATIILPIQRQPESICFSRDGKKVVVSSEGRYQKIYEVDLVKRNGLDDHSKLDMPAD